MQIEIAGWESGMCDDRWGDAGCELTAVSWRCACRVGLRKVDCERGVWGGRL